jgi:hypothetical protein
MSRKKSSLGKEETKTYVESVVLVMLFLLTVLSFVIAGFGFLVPESMLDRLLTNLLLIFLVAESAVMIMLLYRIYQR